VIVLTFVPGASVVGEKTCEDLTQPQAGRKVSAQLGSVAVPSQPQSVLKVALPLYPSGTLDNMPKPP